jgi:hypothetical protein
MGGRMPPSLARWKRAATVEAGILPASERGFQPRVLSSLPGLWRFWFRKPTDESAGYFLSP